MRSLAHNPFNPVANQFEQSGFWCTEQRCAPMRRPQSPGATNKLFVCSLSPTNEFEVKYYFRKLGAVLAVKSVGIGRAGLHFGFVTFKDASSVRLARQDREHHLPSSDIICGEAKPHYRQSGYRRAHGIPSTLPRRTRKRLGYMQRHPPANARPCVLADVVREAPRLLNFLPPDSWSALSASSSVLRQLIRSLTTVISTDTPDNLTILCKGNWPQLA